MTRDERVTKLKEICKTHGRPNNQYYHDRLAVTESNGEYQAWWFGFIEGAFLTELGVNGEGDIYERHQYRRVDGLDLDHRAESGNFPEYNERVDQKIANLFHKEVILKRQERVAEAIAGKLSGQELMELQAIYPNLVKLDCGADGMPACWAVCQCQWSTVTYLHLDGSYRTSIDF